MNVLGGALYGHLPAVVIVSILTAVGSTFCYLLSWFVAGEALLNRWASKRLHQFRRRIKKYEQGNDLFFYLLFMRLVCWWIWIFSISLLLVESGLFQFHLFQFH
jgi:hypothetical protein